MEQHRIIDDTKLILVEGLSGLGKSTTAEKLAVKIKRSGLPCDWYHEMSENHPIHRIYPTRSADYRARSEALWQAFVDRGRREERIQVIESRFLQNSAMDMLFDNHPIDEIVDHNHRLQAIIAPMSPVLIYLDQDDVGAYVSRLYGQIMAGETWMLQMLASRWFRARGIMWPSPLLKVMPKLLFQRLRDSQRNAFVRFFDAYRELASKLFGDFPYPKLLVVNPRDNWDKSFRRVETFFDLEEAAGLY